MKKGANNAIDYHQFLNAYNPVLPHHELDGSSLKKVDADLTLSRSGPLPLSATVPPGSFSALSTTTTNAMDDISVGALMASKKLSSSTRDGGGDDLRKIWHMVLKDCHRSDPDRSGQVSRTVFINALQKADSRKVTLPPSLPR
jgi:hypothetical protein